jgi:hypothetical protein
VADRKPLSHARKTSLKERRGTPSAGFSAGLHGGEVWEVKGVARGLLSAEIDRLGGEAYLSTADRRRLWRQDG